MRMRFLAATDGVEVSAQVGSDIIDVNGGDPNATGKTYPRSLAILKAVAAQLH